MKLDKAINPSAIEVEMIKTAGDTGEIMICNLSICNFKVPTDWRQSFIAYLCKVKGDALDRGNY